MLNSSFYKQAHLETSKRINSSPSHDFDSHYFRCVKYLHLSNSILTTKTVVKTELQSNIFINLATRESNILFKIFKNHDSKA